MSLHGVLSHVLKSLLTFHCNKSTRRCSVQFCRKSKESGHRTFCNLHNFSLHQARGEPVRAPGLVTIEPLYRYTKLCRWNVTVISWILSLIRKEEKSKPDPLNTPVARGTARTPHPFQGKGGLHSPFHWSHWSPETYLGLCSETEPKWLC